MLNPAFLTQLRPFILGLLFIAIVALVFGLSELVMRNARVRSRLDLVGEGSSSQNGSQTLRGDRNNSEWKKLIDRIEKMGISLVDTNNVTLRRRLIAAGYMSPDAPKLFTFFRLVLTFTLPAIFVLTSLGNPEPPTPLTLYMVASILAVFGLYMPNLYISAKASR